MRVIRQLFEFLFVSELIFTVSCGLWEVKVFKTLVIYCYLTEYNRRKNYYQLRERDKWGNGFRLARPVTWPVTSLMLMNPPRKRTKIKSYSKFAGLKRFLCNARSKKMGNFIFLGQWWGVPFPVTSNDLFWRLLSSLFYSCCQSVETVCGLKRTLHTELRVKCV